MLLATFRVVVAPLTDVWVDPDANLDVELLLDTGQVSLGVREELFVPLETRPVELLHPARVYLCQMTCI